VGEKENKGNEMKTEGKKSTASPFKNGGMFEGASHLIFANARLLRKNMTAAETVLWMYLKAGVNDCKFRRQHPIGIYIADFYCHEAKLVLEVDGSIHNLDEVKQNDKEKETYLINNGYSVIRFTNKEIMNQAEIVIEKIKKIIADKIN
jgi:imidazole glycerol-phosphate synthase subunit HisF